MAKRPHTCVYIFHAILKICFPLRFLLLLAGLLYVRTLFVWIYEENPNRVFMYVLAFLHFPALSDQRKVPQPSLLFLRPHRLTHPTTASHIALDRNLNFRKFLPSRSGQFLEKKVVFPSWSYTFRSCSGRKMGGREVETCFLINLRKQQQPLTRPRSSLLRSTLSRRANKQRPRVERAISNFSCLRRWWKKIAAAAGLKLQEGDFSFFRFLLVLFSAEKKPVSLLWSMWGGRRGGRWKKAFSLVSFSSSR